MDAEVHARLTGLIQTPDDHFEALRGFYNNKAISLDEIIDDYKIESGSDLGINSKTLNKLAKYLTGINKDQEALPLYRAVFNKYEQETDFFGLAGVHYRLGNYATAHRFFKEVPKTIDDEENPEHSLEKGYFENYRNGTLPREVLQGLFIKAGTPKPMREVAEMRATLAAINLSKAEAEAEAENADDESESTSPTHDSTHSTSITIPPTSTPIPEVSLGFEVFDSTAIDAATKEQCRQVQTEKHFFSAYRTHKTSTRDLAQTFQSNRQASSPAGVAEDIVVQNVPARRVITADVSTVQASLSCFGRTADYGQSLLDWHVASRTSKSAPRQDELYAPTETMVLSGTKEAPITYQYKHRLDTHSNSLGNFHASSIGTYKDMYGTLAKLAGSTRQVNKNNEQEVGRWMQSYATRGQIVSIEELQGIYANATQDELEALMQIFFHCIIKEPMRWMMPREKSRDLPYATAQARAIQLIIAGHLSLKEVFGQDAPYGVFTGENIGLKIDLVLTKIERINKLYTKRILLQPTQGTPAYAIFQQQHTEGKLVTKRSHLHDELIEMYGGKSDTDGEGYDSDTANHLYPSTFKFN